VNPGLFRKEALDAQRGEWLGEISLLQPLRLWVFAIAAATAALAILSLLVFGSYTGRARVVGELVPSAGLATVVAPEAGVVGRIHVSEDARVRAGAALATVVVPRVAENAERTSAALQRQLSHRAESLDDARDAERAILAARAEGLVAQLAGARRELERIEAEAAIRERQASLADETLERLRRLERDKYVSALQVKQQEDAALERLGDIQSIRRQAETTRRTIADLQQSLDAIDGERLASDAAYRRDLALLEQERVETRARGGLAVTAPVDGMVAAQLVKPGQSVRAGQPLFSLLPTDGRLEAQLLVTSRAIGFVEVGDPVLLRYQAYPYQKFGQHRGRVLRISRSALGTQEQDALDARGENTEPLYRVVVGLDRQTVAAYGRAEPLRPGMQLEADILGERRSLFEWLFEPVYSIRRLAQAAPVECGERPRDSACR
jgi:membrane fusion protein